MVYCIKLFSVIPCNIYLGSILLIIAFWGCIQVKNLDWSLLVYDIM